MGPNRGARIIVPPEAASFKAELWSRGLWVTDADNDVKEGIKTVTSIMGRQMVRIHESCKGLIREIETYAWDPQAAKHGDEKPIKSNDDHVDCLRYGLHGKIPMWRIMGASMKVPIMLPQRNL
jgi:hypothetical protein